MATNNPPNRLQERLVQTARIAKRNAHSLWSALPRSVQDPDQRLWRAIWMMALVIFTMAVSVSGGPKQLRFLGGFAIPCAIMLVAEIVAYIGSLDKAGEAGAFRSATAALGKLVMIVGRVAAVVAILNTVLGIRTSATSTNSTGAPIVGQILDALAAVLVCDAQSLWGLALLLALITAVLVGVVAGIPAYLSTLGATAVKAAVSGPVRGSSDTPSFSDAFKANVRVIATKAGIVTKHFSPHLGRVVVFLVVVVGGVFFLWAALGIRGIKACRRPIPVPAGVCFVVQQAALARLAPLYTKIGYKPDGTETAHVRSEKGPWSAKDDGFAAGIMAAIEEVFVKESAFRFVGDPIVTATTRTYTLTRREAGAADWSIWKANWSSSKFADALEMRCKRSGITARGIADATHGAKYEVVVPDMAKMAGDDPRDPAIHLANFLAADGGARIAYMQAGGHEKTYPAAIGLDGAPRWLDFGVEPHSLVAGTSGSGKTESLVISPILALALAHSPQTLGFYVVDPKSEIRLKIEEPGLPHLVRISSGRKTADMDRHLETILAFSDLINERQENQGDWAPGMPWSILVIDEYQNIMTTASAAMRKQIEDAINSVATVGRSAGCHVILATQRATGAVLSSSILSNLAGRVIMHMEDPEYLVLAGRKFLLPIKIKGRLAIKDDDDNYEIAHGLWSTGEARETLIAQIKAKWSATATRPVSGPSASAPSAPPPAPAAPVRPAAAEPEDFDEPAAPVRSAGVTPLLALGDGWPALPTPDRMSHPDLVDGCALILRTHALVGDPISQKILIGFAASSGLLLSDHPASALRRGLEDAGIVVPHPTKGRNWMLQVSDWPAMEWCLEALQRRYEERDEAA